MAVFTVKVPEGELSKAIGQISAWDGKSRLRVEGALRRGTSGVAREARQRVPVRTGKLKKSIKLFTYYIPTINKTLELFRKLESSDTDQEAYDETNRFLDDCETGLRKHIQNLSSTDLTDLSVEMEAMINIMNIDGLVDRMNHLSISPEKK